ncbi:MAG: hypothetical protein QM504_10990 [Pseudomonadota bacterium]
MNNTALIEKDLYLNKPQIMVRLIDAPITVCVWGRGTGKSEGVIALWLIDRTFKMPRSKIIIIGPTFQNILVNTLPQVIEMWKRMNYHRDVHYVMGKNPPKGWNWPKPYNAPLSPKYAIFWFNGSCQVLVSQDRVSNSAGPSVDGMVGDESKHLNYTKLEETFQTNRGNLQYFGHLSCHNSVLFCTDMPTSAKTMWILDYENQMNEEAIELIKVLQKRIIEINNDKLHASAKQIIKLDRKIKKFENICEEIRKGPDEIDLDNMDSDDDDRLVYFSEFSTIENVRVVGLRYIRDQKRNLSPTKFRASILNERVKQEEGMFYPMLDEDQHYYTKFKYQKIDQIGFDFTKLKKHDYDQDGDIDPDAPLDISLDYNAIINNLTVSQEANTINLLFVKSPLMLKDVVKKFCKYYEDHPTREVMYYFDHTAIGRNAMLGDYTFADQVIDILHDNGWDVTEVYIGQGPSYENRYEMFNNALRGCPELPMPGFNRHNCASLLISMENTMTRQGPSGFEIDKRSERDANILPEHATHAQESWSTWFYGKFGDQWNTTASGFDDAAIL